MSPGTRVSLFLRCVQTEVAGTVLRTLPGGSLLIRWDDAPSINYTWDVDLIHKLTVLKGDNAQ